MTKCKRCSNPACESGGVMLPLSAFGSHKRNSDGLRSQCRECENRQRREYKRERRRTNEVYRQRQNTRVHVDQRNRAMLRRAFVLAIASDAELRCAECGCSDIMKLEVDHVHEDGTAHRAACGMTPNQCGRLRGNYTKRNRYYGSMLKSACDGVQVLCRACNTAKSNRHRAKAPKP